MSTSTAETALRGRAAALDWLGRFVFRYRDYLAPAGLLIVLAAARPLAPAGSERLDVFMDVLGFLVAATGQALRVTVIGYAYIERGGVGKNLSAPRLVSEGFYNHCRNPMYAGNLLLLVGLAMICNSVLVYAVLLPVFLFGILSIIKAEERYLANRFGAEYDDYCRRVPRFVPKLRGLSQTVAGMRFDWRRVVRKEYGTTFAWLSAAFGLMAWERVVRLGWHEALPDLPLLALFYAPVPLAWAAARFLKKTKRLESPEHMTLRTP